MHPERSAYWSALYVWPTALVVSPRLGLLVPRFSSDMKELLYLFGPKNYKNLPPEAKRWNLRVLMAWRLAQAVSRMHLMGVAHSDLSWNNVRANAATGQVRIIDIDGLVVDDFVPPQVYGTHFYIAPEVLAKKGLPGKSADKHALAVLLYQILLYRHPLIGPYDYGIDPDDDDGDVENRQLSQEGIYIDHPSDFRNRPASGLFPAAMLGETIKALFERAFTVGLNSPDARPRADEWKNALGRLLDRIVTCQNPGCHESFYPAWEGNPISCPWCGTALSVPGGIPALRLYEPGPTGPTLLPDFWIAGYPGKTLHQWHRVKGAEPDPFCDQNPIARIDRAGNQWLVANIKCPGMSLLNSNGQIATTIEIGRTVALKENMILRMGGADARILFVQWIR